MAQILLTTYEIDEAITNDQKAYSEHRRIFTQVQRSYIRDKAIVRAQLKKVRGKIAVVENAKGKAAVYNVGGKSYVVLAMLKEDWEALQKEADS